MLQVILVEETNEFAEVATLEAASTAVRNYINATCIGVREWTGGEVFDQDNCTVAHISYNGRINPI